MTTSLQSRNYFVGHSGDTYLRMMLFWSIFMPLGEHFSLDRLRNNTSAKDKAAYSTHIRDPTTFTHPTLLVYVGVGSVGALFQLMYVYTGSALEKRTRAWDAWYREGAFPAVSGSVAECKFQARQPTGHCTRSPTSSLRLACTCAISNRHLQTHRHTILHNCQLSGPSLASWRAWTRASYA